MLPGRWQTGERWHYHNNLTLTPARRFGCCFCLSSQRCGCRCEFSCFCWRFDTAWRRHRDRTAVVYWRRHSCFVRRPPSISSPPSRNRRLPGRHIAGPLAQYISSLPLSVVARTWRTPCSLQSSRDAPKKNHCVRPRNELEKSVKWGDPDQCRTSLRLAAHVFRGLLPTRSHHCSLRGVSSLRPIVLIPRAAHGVGWGVCPTLPRLNVNSIPRRQSMRWVAERAAAGLLLFHFSEKASG